MYGCMHVCMYERMYDVYMYVCMYVCLFGCMYVCMYVDECVIGCLSARGEKGPSQLANFSARFFDFRLKSRAKVPARQRPHTAQPPRPAPPPRPHDKLGGDSRTHTRFLNSLFANYFEQLLVSYVFVIGKTCYFLSVTGHGI